MINQAGRRLHWRLVLHLPIILFLSFSFSSSFILYFIFASRFFNATLREKYLKNFKIYCISKHTVRPELGNPTVYGLMLMKSLALTETLLNHQTSTRTVSTSLKKRTNNCCWNLRYLRPGYYIHIFAKRPCDFYNYNVFVKYRNSIPSYLSVHLSIFLSLLLLSHRHS